jgi:hypothetical protein
LSIRNGRHVILGIIEDGNKIKTWMKGKDQIPRKIYKGKKVAQAWEIDKVQIITEERKEEKVNIPMKVNLTTNSDLILEQQRFIGKI